MSDLPCPKCGGKMDGIGAKMVCGECYHVVDQNAPPPQSAPKVAKDPNAPLPTFAEAPAATLAPGVCPKCNGQTSDVGGRLVCGQCYWVVDQGRSRSTPMPMPSGSTQATAAPAGLSMAHFGIIVTVIILAVVVIMINSLSKMPPPNMNSQQLPFGMHAPGTAATPTSPTSLSPSNPTGVAPANTAPVTPQGMPQGNPQLSPQGTPIPQGTSTAPQGTPTAPQGTQPQMPPPIVPQGGVTSPQSSQPQLPPPIVPQGGVGVGTNQ